MTSLSLRNNGHVCRGQLKLDGRDQDEFREKNRSRASSSMRRRRRAKMVPGSDPSNSPNVSDTFVLWGIGDDDAELLPTTFSAPASV